MTKLNGKPRKNFRLLPCGRTARLTSYPFSPLSYRLCYLCISLPVFLTILLSSLWVSRTGSASDWCALQEALYKCIDTIQYVSHLFIIFRVSANRLENITGRFKRSVLSMSLRYSTNTREHL